MGELREQPGEIGVLLAEHDLETIEHGDVERGAVEPIVAQGEDDAACAGLVTSETIEGDAALGWAEMRVQGEDALRRLHSARRRQGSESFIADSRIARGPEDLAEEIEVGAAERGECAEEG